MVVAAGLATISVGLYAVASLGVKGSSDLLGVLGGLLTIAQGVITVMIAIGGSGSDLLFSYIAIRAAELYSAIVMGFEISADIAQIKGE